MTIDSALLPKEDRELQRDIKTVLSWTPQTFAADHLACVNHANNIKGAYLMAPEGSNARKMLKKAVVHMETIVKALRNSPRS
jgi:hypothetical protein